MSRAIITSAVLALAKRRGYSTVRAAAAAGKGSEGLKVDSAAAASSSTSASPSAYSGSSSWVPDPVTGYYRPTSTSSSNQSDAAATRDHQHSLLSKQQKSRD